MKERPILFSAPMVRAILNGTKTQTRRAIKPVGNDGGFVLTARNSDNALWPFRSHDGESCFHIRRERDGEYLDETPHKCPYGPPGDRLWVRETFLKADKRAPGLPPWVYAADYTDGNRPQTRWKPSLHMPRCASRIALEITGVRVERLQEISETNAIAEGVEHTITGDGWRHYNKPEWEAVGLPPMATARQSYFTLWNLIHGDGAWTQNPWVWVVEFRRVEP